MITAADIRNLIIPIFTGSISLNDLVARIANFFALIAGILAFFYLLYAGILYITSGNNTDQAKKALQALVNVIIGIIIIAFSYLIIRVVGGFIITFIR